VPRMPTSAFMVSVAVATVPPRITMSKGCMVLSLHSGAARQRRARNPWPPLALLYDAARGCSWIPGPSLRSVRNDCGELMPRIHVVNPNSNEAVTRGIDEAVQPLRFADGPDIVCSTLAEGTVRHRDAGARGKRCAAAAPAGRKRQCQRRLHHRLLQRSRPACLSRGHGRDRCSASRSAAC
jgi:hypothetical protein